MSLRHFVIYSALAFVCLPVVSLAATTQTLGKEYVSEVSESGIGVSIKAPEGWRVEEVPGRSIEFADSKEGTLLGVMVFRGQAGDGWSEFTKEHAAMKIGSVYRGNKILQKGKAKVSGQKGLYIVGVDGDYTFKAYLVPFGENVYRFQFAAKTEKWKSLLPVMEKSLATARLLGNAKAPALKAPKKLRAPYIMTGGKYGFDFRVQPPEGWEMDTRDGSVAAFVPDPRATVPKIALLFGREEDENGEWKQASQIFDILTEKQLKEIMTMVLPEWEGAALIKVTTKEKINGKKQGLGMEIKYQELGMTLYGKVVMFEHDGYIYSAVMVSPDSQATWKSHKSILEKSVGTFRSLK